MVTKVKVLINKCGKKFSKEVLFLNGHDKSRLKTLTQLKFWMVVVNEPDIAFQSFKFCPLQG